MAKKALWIVAIVFAFGIGYMVLPSIFRRPVHVVNSTHGDPIIQAAAKQAQDQLPLFIADLTSKKPGQRFAIQGKFKTKYGPEYLWLKDPTYDGFSFTATLDQDPISADMKRGDKVTVFREDVYDWLIRDADGTQKGNFVQLAMTRSGKL